MKYLDLDEIGKYSYDPRVRGIAAIWNPLVWSGGKVIAIAHDFGRRTRA